MVKDMTKLRCTYCQDRNGGSLKHPEGWGGMVRGKQEASI